VNTDNASPALFMVSTFSSFILAVPSSKTFVDTAVGVVRRLLARELFLHAFHTGTKRITASAAFRLRTLKTRLTGISTVIGSPSLGVQTAFRIFTFLPLPRGSLSHD
jgi:hypothetical protein